jgi:hypothetical protein
MRELSAKTWHLRTGFSMPNGASVFLLGQFFFFSRTLGSASIGSPLPFVIVLSQHKNGSHRKHIAGIVDRKVLDVCEPVLGIKENNAVDDQQAKYTAHELSIAQRRIGAITVLVVPSVTRTLWRGREARVHGVAASTNDRDASVIAMLESSRIEAAALVVHQ